MALSPVPTGSRSEDGPVRHRPYQLRTRRAAVPLSPRCLLGDAIRDLLRDEHRQTRLAARDGAAESTMREGRPGADSAEENGDANKDDEAQVRAHVASMLRQWAGETGVSVEEREQRTKGVALEMERALLHKVRFNSDEEEMAWLKEKAAEAGCLVEFEAWQDEKSLDTPRKVWGEAYVPHELEFVRQLGPHMKIESKALLTSLPDGLHVDGDLVLEDCHSLTSLPDGLLVDGVLDLYGCTGLASLPDGLHVGGGLWLRGCTGLASLPGGLHVGGDLDLTGRNGFTSLPDGLHVGGNLILEGCTVLMSLPDGLHVGGDLSLRRCTGLTSMPHGLHVGGNLRLDGCAGLTSLPDGMHVSGYLNLMACTGLTSLPDSVLGWGMCSNGEPHTIYLAGAGLPPEELAHLQALNNPALRFHVSRNEAFGGAGLGADDFTSLDTAAAFWVKVARFPTKVVISPFVEAAYVRGVLGFLSKLRRAKEFNNSLTKVGLASRVVQVLALLTGEDNGVREELMVRMADAVDTCSDKPMWALNQMQVLVHIVDARGDRAMLRALGMGVMRLEVVHRHVRKAMDAMNFIDDVCVYLRFEIALRESLQLPVSALEMLYPSYVTVTDESIAAAEAEALGMTEDDLGAWLTDWSEWQRQDRVEFAAGVEFSALTRNSTERLSVSLHSLMGDRVTDPVRLRPLATVWSLQDLLKHWINTGMDLNNTPRDVDYMRLNLTKCI